jgi:hypothetical protein
MPNKFEVGDAIVGNKSHFYLLRQGMSGKIASEGNGGYYVLWAGESGPLFAFANELYKSPKFKVGDMVVGNSTQFLRKRRGMEGEITGVFGKTYSIIWKGESMRSIVEDSEIDLAAKQLENTTWGDMTPEQKCEILLASHRGDPIELFLLATGSWTDLIKKPEIHNEYCYRVKVKEPVVVKAAKHFKVEGVNCKMTYNKIDGVIDYSSAKLVGVKPYVA